MSVTSSSALVRTRTRERRNTVGENDGVKSPVEKDEADPFQADTASEERIICLGEFFFVQCRPEDPVCVGELQLLWHDKHSGQDLSSTRLYYLPETTPAGRTAQHGEVCSINMFKSPYYLEACNQWLDRAWATRERYSGDESLPTPCPFLPGRESKPRPPTPIAMS